MNLRARVPHLQATPTPPLARSSIRRRRLAVGTRTQDSKQEKTETTRTGPGIGSRAARVGVERTQLARSDASRDGAPVPNLSTRPSLNPKCATN